MTEAEKKKFLAEGVEIPLVWKDGKLVPYKKK